MNGDNDRQHAPELLEDHFTTIPGILRTRFEYDTTSGVIDELYTFVAELDDPSEDEAWGFGRWDVPFHLLPIRGRIYY